MGGDVVLEIAYNTTIRIYPYGKIDSESLRGLLYNLYFSKDNKSCQGTMLVSAQEVSFTGTAKVGGDS